MDLTKIIRKCGLMPTVNWLDRVRSLVTRRICYSFGINPLARIYDKKFFNHKRQANILKNSPKVVVETIIALFKPRSVIDLGCGTGVYLHEFEKKDVLVKGVDGSPAAIANSYLEKDKLLLRDLIFPFNLGEKYDCAICFEVAEHIPNDKSEILVDNIIRLSDQIFFTAASKGQGGKDHINEQDPDFWIDLFQNKGYTFMDKETQAVRKIFKGKNVIFWITNNIMLFKKKIS